MDIKKIYHVTYDESDSPKNKSFVDKSKMIARQITEHIVFRIIIVFIIFADISILIVSITHPTIITLDYVAFGFACIFLTEVLMRIYGLGLKTYFSNWIYCADFLIVILTFVSNLVDICIGEQLKLKYTHILTFLRLLRLPRIIGLIMRNYKKFIKSSRYVTSENKRRFQNDGYDLDLCYVTDRVIAMSFPSSGFTALYRNSITDVAKFFNSKYGNNYKIYNLCEERGYDTTKFHGQVERFMIADHNVPRLEEMIKFAESSSKWLSKSDKNIIAVHCKGGKGRTGTMICVHLIDNEVFDNAELCLQYFGHRRTDLLQGKKFQGVETPSQSRYVGYFEKIRKLPELKVPETVHLKIEKIIIHEAQNLFVQDESEIWFKIILGNLENTRETNILETTLGEISKCKVEKEQTETGISLNITLLNCPNLHDDVKINFYTLNNKVPLKYDKCAFFFWFHTSFIENNQLSLSREQLDNPHKKNSWNIYGLNFRVDVQFSNVPTNNQILL